MNLQGYSITKPYFPFRVIHQAAGVRDSLQNIAPGRTYKIDTLHTLGDRDRSTALYNFIAKSPWTMELEKKLTSGRLDIIVHCLKDTPTTLPETFEIAAIAPRDDPRDALLVKVCLPYTSLATLPMGAVVGTSSVRGSAQLRRLCPHLHFSNLRGNVETRLAKVDDPASEYTCMHRISQDLRLEDGGISHVVEQGALGLEIRKGDADMQASLAQLADCKDTLACVRNTRLLMRTLEGGRSVPSGVESEWWSVSRSVQVTLDTGVHTEDRTIALGQDLAKNLVEAGAEAILKDTNAN
ncbi:porphobilinogen deaminase, dipyromethane cofactor binding domain-containing protein [Aspergillus desertorum]